MPGQIVHFEIPADDTAKGREFRGSLFGWQFESYPGPFEYHMTRISDQAGLAITNMEPGKRGTRCPAAGNQATSARGTSPRPVRFPLLSAELSFR